MTLDRDDDGMPLHDSEEDRAMSAARRLALRDAAPDLLAALTDLVEQLEAIGIPEWNGAEGLCLAQSRAAIAKATTVEVDGDDDEEGED